MVPQLVLDVLEMMPLSAIKGSTAARLVLMADCRTTHGRPPHDSYAWPTTALLVFRCDLSSSTSLSVPSIFETTTGVRIFDVRFA